METLNVYATRLLEKSEYFTPGHRACQGCAEALAVRLVAKALGNNVIVGSATGCMEIISSPLPFTNWKVPWLHVAFENAAAVLSGAEAGYRALVRKGKRPEKGTVFLAMGGMGPPPISAFRPCPGPLNGGTISCMSVTTTRPT